MQLGQIEWRFDATAPPTDLGLVGAELRSTGALTLEIEPVAVIWQCPKCELAHYLVDRVLVAQWLDVARRSSRPLLPLALHRSKLDAPDIPSAVVCAEYLIRGRS